MSALFPTLSAPVVPASRRVTIARGDNLALLRAMASNSLDACVTDPPYGLRFMGKKWDYDVPTVEFWREVYRVLKPGAHVVSFGGTRTYHRLACNIEDAGFEIRDSLHWFYGCLDEDTEVLTRDGWVRYHKAHEGQHALCFDTADGSYRWSPVEGVIVYDYEDTAFRLVGDGVDQLLSRNHRCVVERDGGYAFSPVEDVALEREARVPVLEDVLGLLDCLRLQHEGAGNTERDVLLDVCGGGGAPCRNGEAQALRGVQGPHGRVFSVWETGVEARCVAAPCETADVLLEVQRDDARRGVGEARPQGARGLGTGSAGVGLGEDVGGGQSGVEGWRDVLSEEGELRRDQVCPVSRGVPADGPEGRLRHGASFDCGDAPGPLSPAGRGGSPRGPQAGEQCTGEPVPVRVESGSQTVRGEGHTRAAVARVEPVFYRGVMWCIRVSTGAFVARRNGKVFVTGNSGFPKSLDVSKAFDKAAGAVRTTRDGATSKCPDLMRGESCKCAANSMDGRSTSGGTVHVLATAPATEEAARWAGWGTALKPAHEPIVLARKPLDGTVAENIRKWGTGALNIDGCRVAGAPAYSYPNGAGGNTFTVGGDVDGPRTTPVASNAAGRWPPNVLLTHDPNCSDAGCVEGCPVAELDGQTGTLSTTGTRTKGSRDRDVPNTAWGNANHKSTEYPGDTGGASRFFPVTRYTDEDHPSFLYCAKAARSEREAGCGHLTPRTGAEAVDREEGSAGANSPRAGAGRTAEGVRNHHPTVKPVALMRWCLRLVTPPGGTVLEPFAGSGTTLVASVLEGFGCVGIERDADENGASLGYIDIIEARIRHASYRSLL